MIDLINTKVMGFTDFAQSEEASRPRKKLQNLNALQDFVKTFGKEPSRPVKEGKVKKKDKTEKKTDKITDNTEDEIDKNLNDGPEVVDPNSPEIRDRLVRLR